MKTILEAMAMTQTMFCAIPLPLCKIWNEKARKLMPLFMPMIGLEIGAVWYGIHRLLAILELPVLINGLILSVIPYLLTGFLHLDGFMDVTDAVRSCRSREKMREILKDSRVGAFAVIGFGFLLVSTVILLSSVPENADWRVLIFVPVISRCAAALSVSRLRPLECSSYAGGFWNQSSTASLFLICLQFVLAAALCIAFCGIYAFCLLAEILVFSFALHRGIHALGGMNGDIAGYSITLSELAAIAVLAVL